MSTKHKKFKSYFNKKDGKYIISGSINERGVEFSGKLPNDMKDGPGLYAIVPAHSKNFVKLGLAKKSLEHRMDSYCTYYFYGFTILSLTTFKSPRCNMYKAEKQLFEYLRKEGYNRVNPYCGSRKSSTEWVNVTDIDDFKKTLKKSIDSLTYVIKQTDNYIDQHASYKSEHASYLCRKRFTPAERLIRSPTDSEHNKQVVISQSSSKKNSSKRRRSLDVVKQNLTSKFV